MSSTKKIAEFPDVDAKLQKSTKKSIFERNKAEAEAKRQREAAETAAVFEDFVKSFDRDDDSASTRANNATTSRFQNAPNERSGGFGSQLPLGGSGKRHFGIPSGASGLRSGPGSLGPPPMSFGKKRAFDGSPANSRRNRDEERGAFEYDDDDDAPNSISRAFDASDDEGEPTATARAEEKAISKPTLRLANLPPGTSPAVIKALIPPNLTVENVKILPPAGPSGTERKSATSIVTLSMDTPATEIDAAVSLLQNRYLGFGFYLSLHRHLSSAAMSSATLPGTLLSSSISHPFGAKRVAEASASQSRQMPGHGRGFAPPPSYGPSLGGSVNRGGILHVPIQPPRDIKTLKMIHKVVEAVLEHGPKFEALLMSRQDVQRQERWSWIWDARSEGGIWYRWRLWEIVTGTRYKRGQGRFIPLFEGSHAWKVPDQPLPYEYTTVVGEFVSDSEYNSSDEEDLDEQQNRPAEGIGPNADQEGVFLNPIEKFKLAHFLARLPTTLSKIRKGDIARITGFALTHANRGADEIVDMIIANIERPFAYTSANPEHKAGHKADHDSRDASPAAGSKDPAIDAVDISASRLVGLYVVSDILSSASTSGIRHAWRYRQLFESGLRKRKVFETLGMMADRLGWGRLRAGKWKRSVGLVLSLWEGWCVFPAETQELLVSSFENPPGLKKAERAEEDQKRGRWKPVDAAAPEGAAQSGFRPVAEGTPEGGWTTVGGRESGDEDPEGPTDRIDLAEADDDDQYYSEYTDDEDLDFAALVLEDIDGDPIVDYPAVRGMDSDHEAPTDPAPVPPTVSDIAPDAAPDAALDTHAAEASTAAAESEVRSIAGFQVAATPATTAAASRKRMRAVDMFADSDPEDTA